MQCCEPDVDNPRRVMQTVQRGEMGCLQSASGHLRTCKFGSGTNWVQAQQDPSSCQQGQPDSGRAWFSTSVSRRSLTHSPFHKSAYSASMQLHAASTDCSTVLTWLCAVAVCNQYTCRPCVTRWRRSTSSGTPTQSSSWLHTSRQQRTRQSQTWRHSSAGAPWDYG